MDLFNYLLEDDNLYINGVAIMRELAIPLHDEQIQERNCQVRNEFYYEQTVPNYTDFQFKDHFRMSRQTMQNLLEEIGNLNQIEHRVIPLEKKLLFTIWILSKPESFLAASDRFDLPKSSTHNIFFEVVDLILQLMPQYIRWPENSVRTCQVFKNRFRGITGIVGVIDGCHIPIKQPEGNAHDYFNRKQYHSIILQGICNENAVFIDVNIGQSGRMHDARVFRLSPLYERLRAASLSHQTS